MELLGYPAVVVAVLLLVGVIRGWKALTRVERLERELAELRRDLQGLRARLGQERPAPTPTAKAADAAAATPTSPAPTPPSAATAPPAADPRPEPAAARDASPIAAMI